VSSGSLQSEKKGTLFFDLETQHSFEEVGGRNYVEKLHVSVAVTYSSLTRSFKSYTEPQVFFLIEDLFQAETIVGFNIIDFDYRVLKPYTAKDLNQLHTIDMLAHIKRRLGHRLSLNALAQATLSADKSADGLQAVTWFRQGKIAELTSYCKDDVDITRRLYEFGRENGYLLYHDRFSGETKKVQVEW
jgi:DEAD/DEAH box helicase domain-containing protein